LANIYLHALDVELSARGVGTLVRYADDGVVLCRSAEQATAALAAVEEILGGLGLQLHPGKTKVVDLREGREGFDFLGCHFRAGNAADKFTQLDRYVVWRLRGLMVKKRGRNLRAGQARQWTQDWFNGHNLHQLRGTIRYPKAA